MPTYLQNLQCGLSDLFSEDPRVILLGEDVLDPYGGAFKVTAGLSTRFPGRVLTTPISEAGITGVATGLALRGYVPLVEIMFGDFLTLCADQIVNHATKFAQMYHGVTCPLIVRTPMGGGRGYGPTHSQSLEKMFLGIPGLKLIAPSHYHQPGETLKHVVAMETGPTIFIEHKLLYREMLQTTSQELRLNLETDETGYQTAIVRNYDQSMPDVCLIGYGGLSRFLPELLKRLAAEEIRVLVLLPESVDPLPVETLARFAAEAGRIVIAEESSDGFTWASSTASLLYEKLWGRIHCPIKIVTSDRNIIPTSFDQEAEALVSGPKIESAVLEVLSWA
ncbi:MAG TPA: transketolase C-terminal domain-containing protein [Rhodocyclaceae bacterium]|nr:transketolase C-terminal domain-containing protein [Rhodocyclaceae bacterium]